MEVQSGPGAVYPGIEPGHPRLLGGGALGQTCLLLAPYCVRKGGQLPV
jgi:hypothetical protein